MRTVFLLIASNIFMTMAWYGHLRFKQFALWKVIFASWLIAFFEYCLQVPANRWGHERFTATQLKILQEVITLVVFTGFATLYLREFPRWNYWVAYILIVAAVGFAFLPAAQSAARDQSPSQPITTPATPSDQRPNDA